MYNYTWVYLAIVHIFLSASSNKTRLDPEKEIVLVLYELNPTNSFSLWGT